MQFLIPFATRFPKELSLPFIKCALFLGPVLLARHTNGRLHDLYFPSIALEAPRRKDTIIILEKTIADLAPRFAFVPYIETGLPLKMEGRILVELCGM